MIVDLNDKQIEWIEGHIIDSNKSIEEDMKKGIHDLNKARNIIEFSDFLKELEHKLGLSEPTIGVSSNPEVVVHHNDPLMMNNPSATPLNYQYHTYITSHNDSIESSTSLGDPLSDLAESPDTNKTVEESAKEEMEEVKEKAIEEDIFGDL